MSYRQPHYLNKHYGSTKGMANKGATADYQLWAGMANWRQREASLEEEIKRLRREVSVLAKRNNNLRWQLATTVAMVRVQPPPPVPNTRPENPSTFSTPSKGGDTMSVTSDRPETPPPPQSQPSPVQPPPAQPPPALPLPVQPPLPSSSAKLPQAPQPPPCQSTKSTLQPLAFSYTPIAAPKTKPEIVQATSSNTHLERTVTSDQTHPEVPPPAQAKRQPKAILTNDMAIWEKMEAERTEAVDKGEVKAIDRVQFYTKNCRGRDKDLIVLMGPKKKVGQPGYVLREVTEKDVRHWFGLESHKYLAVNIKGRFFTDMDI